MNDSRTPEELNNPDYNYYLAYNIDPSEKDVKKIETAMAQRKNSFTQGDIKQRRLKDLYANAVEIMKDNALRDAEFQKAKEFKLKDAEKTVVLIAKGRSIYKSDFMKIANNSKKWLSADEIEKRTSYLLQQGIKIIDDTKSRLDFLTYDKIELYLKTIGKKDLYDLLSQEQKINIKSLQNAITATYSRVSGKTDTKSTATNQICGEAKKIFKDEDTKKYYDIYLTTKNIWDDFSLRKSNGIAELELNEYLDYSQKIIKALNNADVDYVEELLAGALNSYKFIVRGGEGKVIDLEECPYCGKAYSNNDNPRACPHCSNPLEVICWNCGGKAPYTVKNSTCPACGAAKDHGKRFDTIIKKIDSLFVQAGISLDSIETELNNLKNLLPDYSKAGSSKLAKKIAEYDDKVSKKKKEEETVGAAYKTEYEKIQELINLKKYFTAQGAVTALKNKYPSYNISKTDDLSKTISLITTRVKQHADKAKILVSQNNEDAAVSEIAAALDLTTDYIEAKQILSKFPPKIPENVNAAIKENAALVTWAEAKQQKMVTYTVVRKNGSHPTTIEDGTTVASELGINFFEDKSIVSDTPYYYAVYAARLGINSSIAFSVSPVITYFDVINIRQEIVSGKIKVKWEAPVNASEVEVIRKKGLAPPASREDGQKITVKNNESFEDTEYDKNGNSYLFVCIYKNEKTVKYSKGVTRHFKTFEELKPLSNVKIEQKGTTSFTLYCDKVFSGKQVIYFSAQAINCEFGKTFQAAEFRNFNKNLNEAKLLVSDESTATFNLPPDNNYYVYPVICNEQLLIVSKPFICCTMIGVSKIVFSETRDEVVITGQPHTLAKTIVAKISNTAFPVTLNSDGDRISITKEDFSVNGLHIKLKANSDSYITIFALTENEGIKSAAFGVPLSTVISLKEKVDVQYVVNFSVSVNKPFPITIKFKSEKPVKVPCLTIVRGNPRPLSISEGQLVDNTPELELKKPLFGNGYTASTTIKAEPAAVNTKFALFPSMENKFITFKEVKNL